MLRELRWRIAGWIVQASEWMFNAHMDVTPRCKRCGSSLTCLIGDERSCGDCIAEGRER